MKGIANLKEEINEYLEVFGDELIASYKEIDSQIDEWFFDYSVRQITQEKESIENIISNTEEIEEKINIIQKKLTDSINKSNYNDNEKIKFKETLGLILENIREITKNTLE